MPAGHGVIVLFFRCDLCHDRLWGHRASGRMATVRADRRTDRHSDVWALHRIFLRCAEQKIFATLSQQYPKLTARIHSAIQSQLMNRETQERKQWVEPVAALLMALATLSTAWCSFESAAWTRQSNRLMNE